jgi:YgiT-type zinc finger domain-containing protein
MSCVLCKHGETRPGLVTVTLQRGETTVVLRHVPADVCDNCGKYYLSSDVAVHPDLTEKVAYYQSAQAVSPKPRATLGSG